MRKSNTGAKADAVMLYRHCRWAAGDKDQTPRRVHWKVRTEAMKIPPYPTESSQEEMPLSFLVKSVLQFTKSSTIEKSSALTAVDMSRIYNQTGTKLNVRRSLDAFMHVFHDGEKLFLFRMILRHAR